MTKVASPTQYIGGIVTGQSAKMAATIIGSRKFGKQKTAIFYMSPLL